MSGWVKFENVMPDDVRVAALSDAAFRLWIHAGCYCSRALSDGFVPEQVVGRLHSSRRARQELLAVGLFLPRDGGCEVDNYLKYNPSRAQVEKMRDDTRNRVTRHRGNAVTDDDVTPDVTPLQERYPRVRDRSGINPEEEQEAFDYWVVRCNKTRAKFTDERRRVVRARLKQDYSLADIKRGIDGAATNPPRDRDSGVVHDDLVSVCRNGAQLERYIARADAQVVPLPGRKESPSDLLRAINGGELT